MVRPTGRLELMQAQRERARKAKEAEQAKSKASTKSTEAEKKRAVEKAKAMKMGRSLTASIKKIEDTNFFMMKEKAKTKAGKATAVSAPKAPAMAPPMMAPKVTPPMMAPKVTPPMMASDKAVTGGYTISTAMRPAPMMKDKRPGTGVFPGSPEDKKKDKKPAPKSMRSYMRASSGSGKTKPTMKSGVKTGPLKGSVKAINGKFHRWDGTKYVPINK